MIDVFHCVNWLLKCLGWHDDGTLPYVPLVETLVGAYITEGVRNICVAR